MKQKKHVRCLAFFLPVLVMLAGFIANGIYPFGDRCFLSTDFYHQYLPFFQEFVRSVKEGNGISYTWNIGLGSNFLALYVYYLASPFHWLGFLVPEAYLIEFLSYLVIFKLGLSGLTAYLYLEKRGKNSALAGSMPGGQEWMALFFSLGYALSGFTAAYNWNIMWLDCVVLLPLIVLGLERMVREQKPGMYCGLLALSILTNYYISIMICLFLVLYFAYLFCTENLTGKRGRVLLQFAGYSLLAGGMAAMLLVPEVFAILETDFGEIHFPDKIESYFSVLDMLVRHCVAVPVEKGLDHWPNIYCGAAAFLFVPLYAMNEKISAGKRFGMLMLTGFLLLGFNTNLLNFIWHGLNYPDSLPARQSFLYIFLVLLMCFDTCCTAEPLEEQGKNRVLHVYLGAVAVFLVMEKFFVNEDMVTGLVWLTLLFVTAYAVLAYLFYRPVGRRMGLLLCVLAMVIMVSETTVNTLCTSISNVSRSGYLEGQEDYRSLAGKVKEQETRLYRIAKINKKTKNDSALAGYPGASVFSSTLNSDVMNFYDKLGMRYSKVFYDFDGATVFVNALLNVRYLFAENGLYDGMVYRKTDQSNDVVLYSMNYELPFGYVAPFGYELPEKFENSALRLQNQMVHDLGIEGQLFVKCDRDRSKEEVCFTAPEDGTYYAIMTASGTKKVKVVGGTVGEQDWKDLKKGSVIYLGDVKEGASLTIANGDPEDTSPKVDADIFRMDTTVLQQALEILSRKHLENVTYDSTRVQGQITLEEPGSLILSIPWEKGWTLFVNGEKARPRTFGGAFITLDLEPGEYTIDMQYVPHGKYLGILISLLSLACFGLFLWRGRKNQLKANMPINNENQ